MKYLVDTNVWLEAGLMRAHGQEAVNFLKTVPVADLAVSDFSLNSLGFFLTPKTPEKFVAIISDIGALGSARLTLDYSDMPAVVEYMRHFRLDYDDAFQYAVIEKFNLTIVSLDADFDRTPRGRTTPAQVLAEMETSGRT